MSKIKQSYALAGVLVVAALGVMAVLSTGNVINNNSVADQGDVLPATSTRERVATTTPPRVSPPTVNVDCMKAAVEKRDQAIRLAYDARYQFGLGALTVREAFQKNVWNTATSTAERKAALKRSWDGYRADINRYVVREWQTARRAAWNQYATDRRACGPAAASEDNNASENLDSQL